MVGKKVDLVDWAEGDGKAADEEWDTVCLVRLNTFGGPVVVMAGGIAFADVPATLVGLAEVLAGV